LSTCIEPTLGDHGGEHGQESEEGKESKEDSEEEKEVTVRTVRPDLYAHGCCIMVRLFSFANGFDKNIAADRM
jgi:hypothetical protein